MLEQARLILASLWEALQMALDAMRAHKMRSFLTLIGVVIGVTTIIGMMTVLGGIKNSLDENMRNSLAVNVFQVQRYDNQMGFGGHRRREFRPIIKASYADAIRERCPSVRRVGVESWDFGHVLRRGALESNARQQIAGGSPEFGDNNGYYVAQGRPITEQDILSARYVIVISDEARRALFENVDPIGQTIRVDAQKFEVIGVFESRGSMLGESQDTYSWIPLSTFERVYGKRYPWGEERSVNLTIQAWSAEVFDQAQEEVIEVLRSERGLKPGRANNFGLWTPSQLQESFTQMTASVGFAAFGVTAVSLLVAGIGIMNIMLVSVTERTREIGLRKALGGTRVSILRQFLIESVMLSEAGGAIGIVLGYVIAIFVNAKLKYPAPVPMGSVVLAIIFCSMVGIGFGMWPAIRAARLDPIEALRHE
ncbi:FtsX-like permease family protein [candidate division KSB1 bacterium]|nr:MAG: FtsX-like permease family protein [candidate division KSB1 bacterium]